MANYLGAGLKRVKSSLQKYITERPSSTKDRNNRNKAQETSSRLPLGSHGEKLGGQSESYANTSNIGNFNF